MATVILTDREQALLPVVGSAMLLRGRELARGGRRLSAQVDVERGRVSGTVGAYEINLTLLHADGRLSGVQGWCSCGLAVPCPHAVAALLAASGAAPASVVTPVTPVTPVAV